MNGLGPSHTPHYLGFRSQTGLLLALLPCLLLALGSVPFGPGVLVSLVTTSLIWGGAVVLLPASTSPRFSSLCLLWLMSRVGALWIDSPSVDDDVYRYVWDGARLILDGTPYAHPPVDLFSQALSSEESWLADELNHPHLATVYGPVWIFFGAIAWLLTPTSLVGWKCLLILAEAWTLWVSKRSLSMRSLLLWISCPLWFWETMLQCHAEILSVSFWYIALTRLKAQRPISAGLLLALALGGRWSMIVPLGVVILCARVPMTLRVRHMAGALIGLVGLTAVTICLGPFDDSGLRALSAGWVFNPIIWKWFPTMPGAFWLLGTGLILILWAKPWDGDMREPNQWAAPMASWMLASSVINPWYFLWLVPALVEETRPRWWGAWLVVIPIVYWQAQWMGDAVHAASLHHHPDVVWWVQFAAIVLGGLLDRARAKPRN